MAKIELLYRYWITDKNGKIVKRSGWRKSKSYVLQWLQIIFAQLKSIASALNAKDITGTLRLIDKNVNNLASDAPSGNVQKGIIVGSGTTAESNADYVLAIPIAHGTGAGQLNYGTQGFTDPVIVAGNVDGVLIRGFVNGSGATVTVREIGVYVMSYVGATACYFCAIRDVLPSAVDVLNGQTLTVQYTLRTTV